MKLLYRGFSIFIVILFSVFNCAYSESNIGNQQEELKPLDIILVLDNSGSMKKNDPEFLTVKFVSNFVKNVPSGANIGLIIFDKDITHRMPLTPITDTNFQKTLDISLESINFRGLLTDSPSAIERAIYELKHSGRDKALKTIVFLTDGIVDTGDKAQDLEKSKWLKSDLTAEAKNNHIRMFCIAFTEQADFQLIQMLARRTDGEYFRTFKVEEIQTVFNRILTLLAKPPLDQKQYTTATTEAIVRQQSVKRSEIPIEISYQMWTAIVIGVVIVVVFIIMLLIRHQKKPRVLMQEQLQQLKTMDREKESGADRKLSESAPAIEMIDPDDGESAGPVAGVHKIPEKTDTVEESGKSAKELGLSFEIPKAYLKDLNDVSEKQKYILEKEITCIGRKQYVNDIIIKNRTVSKQHARIEYKNGLFYLVDLRSANGTYLNKERINGQHGSNEVPLKSGDHISFDEFEFLFIIEGANDIDKTLLRRTDMPDLDELKNIPKPSPTSVTVKISDIDAVVDDFDEEPDSEELRVESWEDDMDKQTNGGKPDSEEIRRPDSEMKSEQTEDSSGIKQERYSVRCYNHSDRKAPRMCSCCGNNFCFECIAEDADVTICKECKKMETG